MTSGTGTAISLARPERNTKEPKRVRVLQLEVQTLYRCAMRIVLRNLAIGTWTMITSAHICFDSREHKVTLHAIAALIESTTEWATSSTERQGGGLVVPQLLVRTPVPFLIQIEDDPEWVPEENLEFGEWAGFGPGSEIHLQLSECDSRLAIQSTMPEQVSSDGNSLVVSGSGAAVDPRDPDIYAVLSVVCRSVGGLLNDCVNGGVTRL